LKARTIRESRTVKMEKAGARGPPPGGARVGDSVDAPPLQAGRGVGDGLRCVWQLCGCVVQGCPAGGVLEVGELDLHGAELHTPPDVCVARRQLQPHRGHHPGRRRPGGRGGGTGGH